MWELIGQNLPAAVSLAVSIAPLIAVIVLLTSKESARLAPTFVAAWFLAVVVAILVLSGIGQSMGASEPSGATATILKWVPLGIALLFVWLGFKSLQGRPPRGETVEEPEWVSKIDTLTHRQAFWISAAIVLINPKNIPLVISMASTISASGLAFPAVLVVAICLGLVSASGALASLLLARLGGSKAQETLGKWRNWLIQNGAVVAATLFFLLAVVNLGQFIEGLQASPAGVAG